MAPFLVVGTDSCTFQAAFATRWVLLLINFAVLGVLAMLILFCSSMLPMMGTCRHITSMILDLLLVSLGGHRTAASRLLLRSSSSSSSRLPLFRSIVVARRRRILEELGMLDRVVGVHIACFALSNAVFCRLQLCNELDVWIVLLLI